MLALMDSMPTFDQIRQFDQPGPRYTSYPTADHFAEAFDAEKQGWWLGNRALRQPGQPVTVYVHIPFCESICHYCACNRIGTRDFSRASRYFDTLRQEIELYAAHLPKDVRISQLHLGGGTPTFFSDELLKALVQTLDERIGYQEHAERSIEVDPRTVDAQRMENIRAMGFNRVSFGVQDLNPTVQQAIHRIQPESMIVALMEQAGQLDFRSINIDLVYGLPRQTLDSLAHTLDRMAELRPGRLAIYGYAHMPSRFKAQRLIDTKDLPDLRLRTEMLHLAITKLNEAGYRYIGMDHFALPDDDLSIALERGTLRRNFMGYTAMPDDDLIGLGVSAISAIGPSYSQNHRELKPWTQAIQAGQLPIARGIELTGEDTLQRAIIMELMCQGRLDFQSIEDRFLVDPLTYFHHELEELTPFIEGGLVRRDASGIEVNPVGRYFLRSIAMSFDRHAQLRRRQREQQQQQRGTAHQGVNAHLYEPQPPRVQPISIQR
ncbi:MAG: oxygen-independent coproporphyrinogen III oxidase [Lautropia sp.]|nr:oxygen-independent coproporphyrinogen III oxidase [Lautropia sp.]